MSLSFCKVTSSAVEGGTGANARYILRERACDRWETRHLPEHAVLGATALDRKRSVAEEMDRQAEKGWGSRRDYRVILSFEKSVSSEKALAMAREFLDQSHFRNNPALMSVHRNTDHVHVHVLLVARQTDGRKLHLDRGKYESFDKLWARIYGREMSREKAATRQSAAERIQTRRERTEGQGISLAEWRRHYGRLRREGKTSDEIKAILGPRPKAPSLEVNVHHIRKNEHEKGRIAIHLQAARSALERSQGNLGRTDREDPGADRTARVLPFARGRERAMENPVQRAGSVIDRARGAMQPRDGAPERDVANFLRDVGSGMEREAGRLVRAIAGAGERARSRVVTLEGEIGRAAEPGRGRAQELCAGVRAELAGRAGERSQSAGGGRSRELGAGLRQRFNQRLGECVSRLNFRDQIHPLLRTLEKYLDRLPESFEKLRERFQEVKGKIWESHLGRKPNFRDEMSLLRTKDPEIRFHQDLDFTRQKGKSRGFDRER